MEQVGNNQIEKMYRAARDALYSDAWNHLVSVPNELIAGILVDKVKELYPDLHEPDKDEAKRFLSTHFEKIKISLPLIAIEPSQTTETSKGSRAKPKAFTFNGQRYEVKHWNRCLIKFCEILSEICSDRFAEVLTLDLGEQYGPYFSKDRTELRKSHLIHQTDIYVARNVSSYNVKKIMRLLAIHFGYDEPFIEETTRRYVQP